MSDALLAMVEIEQPIATDLPSFDGHFPGAPVLPGAVLVSLVLRAIAQRSEWAHKVGSTPRIQQVKFLAAIGPGQTLHIHLDDTPSAIAFSVRCGATAVARGQVTKVT
jgi:3-hydroxymyristoyl/3-hydroxydecanoyl-(acyl carrier protein) dehydratase